MIRSSVAPEQTCSSQMVGTVAKSQVLKTKSAQESTAIILDLKRARLSRRFLEVQVPITTMLPSTMLLLLHGSRQRPTDWRF
mmetsp:Transcript_21119/g.26941  ORF Transcript_21119/g.26941 Transcript_21119/m.26941 type:complete len:82 (-) Transcript_21119:62-307(-)